MSEASNSEKCRMLQSRIQLHGGIVYVYFHEKIRTCGQLKLKILDSKKMICSGLQSREVSNVLMSKTHATEEGLLLDIRDYLGVNPERSALFKSQSVPTTHSKQTYEEIGNVAAVFNKSTSTEQYKE